MLFAHPERGCKGRISRNSPPTKATASTLPVGSIGEGLCAAAPQIWGLWELADRAELARGMLRVQQPGGEQAKPQSPWLPMQKALSCIPQLTVCRARACTLLCLGVGERSCKVRSKRKVLQVKGIQFGPVPTKA